MKKALLLVIVFILAFGNLYAQAQPVDETRTEEDRLIEDEVQQELEQITKFIPPPRKKFSIRFGGWLSSIFRNYTNTDNDKDADESVDQKWFHEIRLWTKMSFFRKYNIYLRVKNNYTDRTASSTNYSGIGDDYRGPTFDVGYFSTKIRVKNRPVSLVIGRQYVYIGRGITYRNVHDGIKTTFETANFFYKAFLTQTLPDADNIDTSQPEYEKKGDRLFYGLEMGYLGFPNSVVYGYFLRQRDKSPTYFPGDAQAYSYDSEYLGIGFEGEAAKLGYAAEIIRETGKTYTDFDERIDRSDVSAWAYNFSLRYLFDVATHPLLEVEYAYGSGDEDRTSVVESTTGGNIYGDDKNFLYFGTYYSGYALSPRLSNIQIYKIHLAFSPFERFDFGEGIVCGFKYYFYRKVKAEGGIYDSDATQPFKHIGHETDFYLYWNITPRLRWSFRYGVFFPGKAYPRNTNSNTRYLYTRVKYSF